LTLFITEVFGDSKTSKSDTSTSPWRFVHLTEDERDLGFTIKLNDLGFLHFVVKIVTLARPLAHTSEDRVTSMSLGNVVLYQKNVSESNPSSSGSVGSTYNKLLNEDSLSDTCTSEKTNLSSTGVGGE